MRAGPWAAGALLLLGCGVAGMPVAPGPRPVAAPVLTPPISTADAIELRLAEQLTDVDGAPVDDAELVAFGTTDCSGPALAHGRDVIRLPVPWAGQVDAPASLADPRVDVAWPTVRVVAARHGRLGAPSAPVRLTWSPPPPPPEAPLAFVDGAGAVQLSWLPPPPPVDTIWVYRGDAVVARIPAEAALWTDTAPPGRHAYRLVGASPSSRSGPSAEALVDVPAP